jgi:REP element-mobilizing transposase RayT
MALARKHQFDQDNPPWIHAITRCCRKCYLFGGRDGKFDHRWDWVQDRLAFLSGVFAVEVAGFSVMSNHFHVVLRMDPTLAASWSAEEVVRRWMLLHPLERDSHGNPVDADAGFLARYAGNATWVSERRRRLWDLGWLMRELKETIARQANKEDECTGSFFEGRYTSVPLFDQAALLACMAYVDLNPVRAKIVEKPEDSSHTGITERLRGKTQHEIVTQAQANSQSPQEAIAKAEAAGVPIESQVAASRRPDGDTWLCPLEACKTREELWNRTITLTDYLTLVDLTGRMLAQGKRGKIPQELPGILSRLDLKPEAWLSTMAGWRSMNGGGVGTPERRTEEAQRRGKSWVKNQCPLFGVCA